MVGSIRMKPEPDHLNDAASAEGGEDLFGQPPPAPKGRRRKDTPPPAPAYSRYARVALNQPVFSLYDYGIPDALGGEIGSGSIVEVPLSGRITKGMVVSVRDAPPDNVAPNRIKAVSRRLSPGYALEPNLVELGRWISDYYLSPPGETLGCLSFVGFHDVRAKTTPLLRMTPEALTPPADPDPDSGRRKPTPQHGRVVAHFASSGNAWISPDRLRALANVSDAVLRRLLKAGILESGAQEQDRPDDYGAPPGRDNPIVLNPTQRAVLASITESMDRREAKTFLIHGVTGSGKTEVYLQAIQKGLDEGGTAIVLVPEISLTPQTVDRFRSRFGDTVGVYHSKLTPGQKFDLWRRVRSGACRIMVGARSALFTPFPDLRIIVIDEEHETSYKQDGSPRYHARDVAIIRARSEKTVVVLGSATPSVETFYKARSGKFELLSLPDRVDNRQLPPVSVVDMTREAKENRALGMFSEGLRAAMEQALERGEQILLFLNRRGFFNFMVCLECNEVVSCPHCSVALTHHKPRNVLMCHYCLRESRLPVRCPACEGTELNLVGLGTQRIEEAVNELFPEARVIRMDLDTTRQRNAYLDAWRRIERGDFDVILGTQMIAKGIHLERVTLVGVPLADVSLFQPDFRSAERAFSVLTQVAGRAGRGDRPGQVIIQTYAPHHYAIGFAQTHDYLGFYEKEIRIRKVLRFPPIYRLVGVLGTGRDPERTADLFKEFGRMARNAAYAAGDAVTVLGPVPAPIARINDQHRWRLLLRGADHKQLKEVLNRALQRFDEVAGKSAIHLTVDVDPHDLM